MAGAAPSDERTVVVSKRESVGVAVTVALAAYGLFLFLPLNFLSFRPGLDESYMVALHMGFERGLAFGREMIFTAGPYGFLNTRRFYPATYPITLVAWIGFGLVTGLACARIARSAFASLPVRLLWGVLVVTLTTVWIGYEVSFYALCIFLLAERFLARDRGALFWAIVVALALAGLVKFSFFAAAAIAVVTVSADETVRERRPPWTAIVFGAAVVVFWLLAGQSILDLPAFLGSSIEISSAYAPAMSFRVASLARSVAEVASFAALAILLVATVFFAIRHEDRRAATIHALGLGGLLYVLLKAGFVRQDGHVLIAAGAVLIASAVYAPFVRTARPLVAAALAWGLVAAAIGCSALLATGSGDGSPSIYSEKRLVMAPVNQAADLARAIRQPGIFGEEYERMRELVRRLAPVDGVEGTTDVYSYDQVLVHAHGFDYAPRPMFQSYGAYTPRLAELNAAHLRGPGAPESIVFRVETIDYRYPAVDDALSWPELLSRYDVAGKAGDALVLRRAAVPREVRLVEIGSRVVQFGETVEVPEGGPVWVSLEIRPTLLGAVAGRAFKTATVTMRVTTAAGPSGSEYRIVPATAGAGFLLSPYVPDTAAFERLFAGAPGTAVTSIALFERPATGVLYEADVRVTFYRLERHQGRSR